MALSAQIGYIVPYEYKSITYHVGLEDKTNT